jgi:enamine deaminase RidA (YjgF/YER057c/UK114 family)
MKRGLEREQIQPAAVHAAAGYAHGVRVGPHLYVSGQVPRAATGEIAVGDFASQARQVFANLLGVVEAAGGTRDDIVKVTTYLTNADDFETWRRIRSQVFPGTVVPASTLVVVASLSHPDYLLEIEATAFITS